MERTVFDDKLEALHADIGYQLGRRAMEQYLKNLHTEQLESKIQELETHNSLMQDKVSEAEAYAKGAYQDVRALAEAFNRDPLTGLLGRKGLEEAYLRTAAAQRRNNKPGSIMFADLDDFKSINEELGHGQADKLLKAVGKTLETNVRRTDYVGRAHGDEFIIILPETDLEKGKVLGDKLRKIISESNIFGVRVTMSIGIDMINPLLPFEEAYYHANEAMFAAKREGKDRIISARTVE